MANKNYSNDTAIQALIQIGSKVNRLIKQNEKLKAELNDARDTMCDIGLNYSALDVLNTLSTWNINDDKKVEAFANKLLDLVEEYRVEQEEDDEDIDYTYDDDDDDEEYEEDDEDIDYTYDDDDDDEEYEEDDDDDEE